MVWNNKQGGVTWSVRFHRQTAGPAEQQCEHKLPSHKEGTWLHPSELPCFKWTPLSNFSSILFDEILTCDEWQFKPAGLARRLSEAGSPHLSRPDNLRGLDFFQGPPKTTLTYL